MSDDIYDVPLQRIDGAAANLGAYRGSVLLLVNVASKCGFTPQYEGLEALHKAYRDRGFSVVGFPANDFAGQEPGSNAEIAAFCRATYGVDFPLFSKISVTGPDKHPLYRHLTAARPDAEGRDGVEAMLRSYKIEPTPRPEVVWNFEKFLIGRDGRVAARFAPDVAPGAPQLVAAIEAELAKA